MTRPMRIREQILHRDLMTYRHPEYSTYAFDPI
jgi:hypothetical protein